MVELCTIDLKPFVFTPGTALSCKRSMDLYATAEKINGVLPIGFGHVGPDGSTCTLPPGGIRIVEMQCFREAPEIIPANDGGNFTFAIDRLGTYDYACGADAKIWGHQDFEYSAPHALNRLGFQRYATGESQDMRIKHDENGRRLIYRPGDLLICAPEFYRQGNSESYTVIPAIVYELPDGYTPLGHLPGVVMAETLDYGVAAGSGPPVTYRTLVSNLRNTVYSANHQSSQTQVRPVLSTLGAACKINSMSIGLQASGPNMTAMPAPVLFGGNASVTIPPYSSVKGDWTPLATADGDAILVDFQLDPAFGWALRGLTATTNCIPARDPTWYSTANGHAQQNLGGTIGQQEHTRQVVCGLEVGVP